MARVKRMNMATFIRQNKDDIDRVIKKQCSNCPLSDKERRLWVLNDEQLYNWARKEGVRI